MQGENASPTSLYNKRGQLKNRLKTETLTDDNALNSGNHLNRDLPADDNQEPKPTSKTQIKVGETQILNRSR
jgi:hypothetical protein